MTPLYAACTHGGFPFPDEPTPADVARHVSLATPLADDLDLEFLARQFALTGGNIKNAALAAAFFGGGKQRRRESAPRAAGHPP